MAQTRPNDEGIRRDQMVDLVAVSLAATPGNPITGEQVRLSLTIANQSENNATGVGVVLLAGKTRVATATVDVAARQKVVVPLTWTPPTAGAWELTALVDPDQRQVEENRADNVVSLDLAVADAAQKNAAFCGFGSRPGHAWEDALRSARGCKITGRPPPALRVVFRIGDRVAAVQYVANLAPGASTLVEVPVAAPAGAVRISAEANPRLRTGTQALASKDIGLARDLRVEGLSVHSARFETSRPRRVIISFRIVNAGQTPITTPFRTRIFPGVVKSGVLAEDFVTTPRLAPGESVYVSRMLDAPPAEFDIRVEADVDQATGDQDRTNNVATARFQNPSPNVDRWVALGPRRIDGEGNIGAVGALFHLAINPQAPSTIYVGGNGEGIWKTVDGGQNWQPITDSLPTLLSVALALDPSNPSRLYLVTPDQGVFKTADGGGSWAPLDTPSLSTGRCRAGGAEGPSRPTRTSCC